MGSNIRREGLAKALEAFACPEMARKVRAGGAVASVGFYVSYLRKKQVEAGRNEERLGDYDAVLGACLLNGIEIGCAS